MSNNAENRFENNAVVLAGEVAGTPVYSHEVYGEGFYVFDMSIPRESGNIDTVPVMVSERMCNIEDINVGKLYEVVGQFRSYNRHEEKKNRLILSVFAVELNPVTEDEFIGENHIDLDGYVCKEPVYRKTPLGREIADLLIAVNRAYGKSDYIPCITWGRNARFASTLEVGQRVQLQGRIQSREYVKKISEDNSERHTAYELSASRIVLSIHDCLAYRWNTDCKYSGTDSNAHVLVLLHTKSHNNVAYHAYTDECEAYGKRSCRRSAYSIPCRASYFCLRDDFQPVSI